MHSINGAYRYTPGRTSKAKLRDKNMLIRYKKSYKKIAMGLLSLIPKERELKKLLQTIKMYEENQEWQLYLWKECNAFIGLVGTKTDGSRFVIQHISVLPSRQREGIGRTMISEVQHVLRDQSMSMSPETEKFFFNHKNAFQELRDGDILDGSA